MKFWAKNQQSISKLTISQQSVFHVEKPKKKKALQTESFTLLHIRILICLTKKPALSQYIAQPMHRKGLPIHFSRNLTYTFYLYVLLIGFASRTSSRIFRFALTLRHPSLWRSHAEAIEFGRRFARDSTLNGIPLARSAS